MPRFEPNALLNGFAERDSGVFDGVMLVHVEVAAGDEFQIEAAVARDLFEHVIEEADAGINVRLAASIEIELQTDIGFLGFAL